MVPSGSRENARVAVFGGSFDPVHRGHMAIASGLLKKFSFDEVLFVPANVAPHKQGSDITPAIHRFAMLALATQFEPRFRITTVELEPAGVCYTVNTLERIYAELGAGKRMFFVMGSDSWSDITSWRQWERILRLADHIVITRPGFPLKLDHVGPHVRSRVVDLRGCSRELIRSALAHESLNIFFTDVVRFDVSASRIRRAVQDGNQREIGRLAPLAVAGYIRKYGLYRNWHEVSAEQSRCVGSSEHQAVTNAGGL